MILDEKGLCRALKRAYKQHGYTVMAQNGRIMAWTEDWYIHAKVKELPNKVLALMVEHLGTLPGEATVLQKGETPQLVMQNTAAAETTFWQDMGECAQTMPTAVEVSGMRLMQDAESGQCVGIGTEIEIVNAETWTRRPGVLTKEKLIYMEGGELAAMIALRPVHGGGWMEEAWKVLEKVPLTAKI